MAELFPSAAPFLDPVTAERDVRLDDPGQVVGATDQLLAAQDSAGTGRVMAERFSLGALEDIRKLVATDRIGTGAQVVLSVRVCLPPLGAAFATGDTLGVWHWLHRAVAADVHEQEGWADQELGRVLSAVRDPVWGALVAVCLSELGSAVFYLASTQSSAVVLADTLYPVIFATCQWTLAERGTLLRPLAEAAVHMIPWQLRTGRRPEAVVLARALEDVLYQQPQHELAAAVAMLLSKQPERLMLTSRRPQEIAQWASVHIVGLTPLQDFGLRLNVVRHVPESEWARSVDSLADRVRRIVPTLNEWCPDPFDGARTRAQLLAACRPVLYDLVQRGDLRRLSLWLAAWKGIEPERARHDRCVALVAGGDRAWYRPGTTVSASGEEPLIRLTRAVNAALGQAIVVDGYLDSELTVPATGRKNPAHAQEFEDALRGYLDVDDLIAYTTEQNATAYCPLFPSMMPVQALVARAGGPALPITLSAETPYPDRSVRRVQFWCGDVCGARQEYEVIERIFSNSGAQVDLVDTADITSESFLETYKDDHYDVIWVASHGVHPPYRPESATIALSDDATVALRDLIETRRTHASHRRLLVLNTCDSAASDSAGPVSEMGLGRSITGPDQAVVGHLWPVDTSSATIFAALLAAGLADARPYSDAFDYALTWLQRPWADLAAEFQDRDVGRLVAEPLQHFQGPTILDWGSAAFFE